MVALVVDDSIIHQRIDNIFERSPEERLKVASWLRIHAEDLQSYRATAIDSSMAINDVVATTLARPPNSSRIALARKR